MLLDVQMYAESTVSQLLNDAKVSSSRTNQALI